MSASEDNSFSSLVTFFTMKLSLFLLI